MADGPKGDGDAAAWVWKVYRLLQRPRYRSTVSAEEAQRTHDQKAWLVGRLWRAGEVWSVPFQLILAATGINRKVP